MVELSGEFVKEDEEKEQQEMEEPEGEKMEGLEEFVPEKRKSGLVQRHIGNLFIIIF